MASRHPNEDEAHNQALEEASARAARAKREWEAEKLDMAKKHIADLDETSRKVSRHAEFRFPVSQGTRAHSAEHFAGLRQKLSLHPALAFACTTVWSAHRAGFDQSSLPHVHARVRTVDLGGARAKTRKSRHLAEAWLGSHRWLD